MYGSCLSHNSEFRFSPAFHFPWEYPELLPHSPVQIPGVLQRSRGEWAALWNKDVASHSFTKYVLSIYCVPGILLGARGTELNRSDQISLLTELTSMSSGESCDVPVNKVGRTQFQVTIANVGRALTLAPQVCCLCPGASWSRLPDLSFPCGWVQDVYRGRWEQGPRSSLLTIDRC